MNLYLISQEENNGYETYSDAVVCAETEEEARDMHPYDGKPINWTEQKAERYCSWASNKESVNVTLVGRADARTEKGLVCHSFHAG